VIYWIFQVQRN